MPLPVPCPARQGGGADRAEGEGQVGGSLEKQVQVQPGVAGPLQPTIISYESLKKGNSSTMVAGEGTVEREISSEEVRVSCVTREDGTSIGPTRGRLSMHPSEPIKVEFRKVSSDPVEVAFKLVDRINGDNEVVSVRAKLSDEGLEPEKLPLVSLQKAQV